MLPVFQGEQLEPAELNVRRRNLDYSISALYCNSAVAVH